MLLDLMDWVHWLFLFVWLLGNDMVTLVWSSSVGFTMVSGMMLRGVASLGLLGV